MKKLMSIAKKASTQMTESISGNYFNVKNDSTLAGTPIVINSFSGSNNQKFRFEWCNTGYKIHSLNNEKLVLTLNLNSDNTYSVYMGNDLDEQGQIWEVLPYSDSEYGLVIRSKVLYYEGNDIVGKALYLNYNDAEINVSTQKNMNTKISLEETANWIHFGKAYLDRVGWINCNYDSNEAFVNYNRNRKHILNSDVKKRVNNVDVILNQHNALFKDLIIGESMMYDVACEVIATYNAITLNSQINHNFYRISFEFEMNAIWNFPQAIVDILVKFEPDAEILSQKAGAGSNYLRIEDCLEAYNIYNIQIYIPLREYDAYNNYMYLYLIEGFLENNQSQNPVVITTYLNPNNLHIHTISFTIKDDGKIYSINEDLGANTFIETGELIDYMNSDYIYLCMYYCV